MEIDARLKRLPHFTLALPEPFSLEQLTRAMEICNRHCGNPDKHIGGPELPPQP